MKISPIAGICLLLFGLLNILWYLPLSFGVTLKNTPFPFAHLKEVIPQGGISTQVGYLPLENAIHDPYGIAVLLIVIFRAVRHSLKQS